MAVRLPPEVETLAMRLRQLEEQLRLIVTRRQQVRVELIDVENAIEELNKVGSDATVYRAVGTIMVRVNRDKLLEELTERKETLELQERTLARQEANLRRSYEEARKQLEKALEKYKLSPG